MEATTPFGQFKINQPAKQDAVALPGGLKVTPGKNVPFGGFTNPVTNPVTTPVTTGAVAGVAAPVIPKFTTEVVKTNPSGFSPVGGSTVAPSVPATPPKEPIQSITQSTEKPKEIKISSADPNFEQTAGALLIQRQKEKAVTDQLMQNQAARSQFMQQLQDAGTRGGTLGTLAMLKDRELNSALSSVEWDFTNKYMDYLQDKTDSAESESKLQFMTKYNDLLKQGMQDEANTLIAAMAKQFPDDSFIQTAATPEYQNTVIGEEADAASRQRKITGFTNAANLLTTKGDVFNPTTLTQNAAEILGMLRSSVTAEQLKLMAATVNDKDMASYLKEFYPSYEGLPLSDVPESIKEEAALMKDFQGQLGKVKGQQAQALAEQKVLSIQGLNDTTRNQLKGTLELLSQGGGDVSIAGVTVPADYFSNMDSGASSIFVSDWDGDSNFNERIPEANTLDGLWMRVVNTNGGDFTINGMEANGDLRDSFAQRAFEVATDMGFTAETFPNLTKGQMDLIADRIQRETAPEATGPGSYASLANAFRSKDINSIEAQLQTMSYADPKQAASIERAIDSLEHEMGGALPSFNGDISPSDPMLKEPGYHWMTVPNGYGGRALVLAKVEAPTFNSDDGMVRVPIQIVDPARKEGGASVLPEDTTMDVELTPEQASRGGVYSEREMARQHFMDSTGMKVS